MRAPAEHAMALTESMFAADVMEAGGEVAFEEMSDEGARAQCPALPV